MTRINVDDFHRTDVDLSSDAYDRAAAFAALAEERRDPYEWYWAIFTEALEHFRAAREVAWRAGAQLDRDRAQLPRGHWLILRASTVSLDRHNAMQALSGDQQVRAAVYQDLLGAGSDGGAARAAARQIVGSCWPRFRRALKVVHAATDYLRAQAVAAGHVPAVSSAAEP